MTLGCALGLMATLFLGEWAATVSTCCRACYIYVRKQWPSSQAQWTQALVFLFSRVWVRVPVLTLVSLKRKTLNHCCFALWLGLNFIGPVYCVMLIKEPQSHSMCKYHQEKGFAQMCRAVAADDALHFVNPCTKGRYITGSQN